MHNAPIYTVHLSEYQVVTEPDYRALGKVVDDELRKHFMGQTVVVRGIGSSEHPGKSIDELVEIIQRDGTDRYHNIHGKHIDLFGFRRKITQRTQLFKDVIYGFYHSALRFHGRVVRIDVLIIYDASKLKAVVHQYEGLADKKRDGFVFKNPTNKTQALLGIIKITGARHGS